MKNKRGAITDIIMWVVIGIVVVIVMALFYYAFAVKTLPALKGAFVGFQNVNGQNLTNMTNYVVDKTIQGFEDNWSWITFGILIVMALNILLGCFLVRVNPAVSFVIYVLVGISAFVISIPVSNGYSALVDSGSEFAALLSGEFKGASFIMANLPIWVAVVFFVGLILLISGIPRDRGFGGGPTA